MAGEGQDRPIHGAIYGTGSFANRTHIPNLMSMEGVEIVTLCDEDADALASAAFLGHRSCERTCRD